MKELQGKVAVVTGAGLPKGMGSAAARELAKQGASVVVTDLEANLKGLEKLVKEIELLGSKGLAVKVDVTNPQEIEACVKKHVKCLVALTFCSITRVQELEQGHF